MTQRLKSFVEIHPDSDFPLENLPYGIFNDHNNSQPRACFALGEWVIDLAALEENGYLKLKADQNYFNQPTLNKFIESGKPNWSKVRTELQLLFSVDNPVLRDNTEFRKKIFSKQTNVK